MRWCYVNEHGSTSNTPEVLGCVYIVQVASSWHCNLIQSLASCIIEVLRNSLDLWQWFTHWLPPWLMKDLGFLYSSNQCYYLLQSCTLHNERKIMGRDHAEIRSYTHGQVTLTVKLHSRSSYTHGQVTLTVKLHSRSSYTHGQVTLMVKMPQSKN
jgi:hypothetical protein